MINFNRLFQFTVSNNYFTTTGFFGFILFDCKTQSLFYQATRTCILLYPIHRSRNFKVYTGRNLEFQLTTFGSNFIFILCHNNGTQLQLSDTDTIFQTLRFILDINHCIALVVRFVRSNIQIVGISTDGT